MGHQLVTSTTRPPLTMERHVPVGLPLRLFEYLRNPDFCLLRLPLFRALSLFICPLLSKWRMEIQETEGRRQGRQEVNLDDLKRRFSEDSISSKLLSDFSSPM